jgi:hypothetical protein
LKDGRAINRQFMMITKRYEVEPTIHQLVNNNIYPKTINPTIYHTTPLEGTLRDGAMVDLYCSNNGIVLVLLANNNRKIVKLFLCSTNELIIENVG